MIHPSQIKVTPDAALKGWDDCDFEETCANLFDHARRLERERDEARRMAEHNRTAFLRLAGGHPESIRLPWETPLTLRGSW